VNYSCDVRISDTIPIFLKMASNYDRTGNIDRKLENFLEKHFPKEVFVKRIQVETERGKDQFGPTYVHPKDPDNPSSERCVVM